MPREDDSSGIAVDQSAVVTLVAKSRLDEKLFLVASFQGCFREGIAPREGITQLEFLDDVIPYATAAEILLADGLSVGILEEQAVEIGFCPFVHHIHRLPFVLFLPLFVAEFLFLDLNVVFAGEPAQGFGITDLLVLHEEAHRRSALAAGKAMADAFGWRNDERRRFVIVEGAQPFVVDACLPQCHKL